MIKHNLIMAICENYMKLSGYPRNEAFKLISGG
jgi:hypothetical protein